MNKTPITLWVNIEEPAIEFGKIVVKKGNFYYNGNKYNIENGKIVPYSNTTESIPF